MAFVKADIERLWELENLPGDQMIEVDPTFPLRKLGDRYEIGLLWKGCQRPKDNFWEAKERLASLLCKLDRNGQKEVYEDVLMREYSTLEAIEREPRPEEAGYYLPHHAVI